MNNLSTYKSNNNKSTLIGILVLYMLHLQWRSKVKEVTLIAACGQIVWTALKH